MTFDSLKYEKDKFQKRTHLLNQEEIDWIINRVLRDAPNLFDYQNNQKHEEELLNKVNFLIYDFEKNKPSDIRAYVEKELKKKEFDNKLSKLTDKINWNLFGNDKACAELRKEISSLLDEADKEFPGFSKARALQISEMSQRIMAYRTKGAVGHIGTVRSIRERLDKEEKSGEKKMAGEPSTKE